jgi:guanylate kinase
MHNAHLYTISAPSGAGKTSLVKALIQQVDNLKVSISYTTRAARAGEVNGVDYHFIDVEQFEFMRQNGEFLEYANVFGNYYATSKTWLQEQLTQGIDIILEIDWQGAQIVRQTMLNQSIFILPPSKDILAQRLRQRGLDAEAVIQRRLSAAVAEMRHCHEFDYLIVNDEFALALQQLIIIIQSQRLRLSVQQSKLSTLLQQLLG